jgi:putative transcriptional regulator
MKAAAFQELLETVRDAGAYLKGNRKAVARTDRISPHSVAAIRAKLKLSQALFARAFGISLDTLKNWEQGRRQPTGPCEGATQSRRTPSRGHARGRGIARLCQSEGAPKP